MRLALKTELRNQYEHTRNNARYNIRSAVVNMLPPIVMDLMGGER